MSFFSFFCTLFKSVTHVQVVNGALHLFGGYKHQRMHLVLTTNQEGVPVWTQEPDMPIKSCALAARALALLWGVPLVPVNHCVAHIEMGRLKTGISDPVVLYVSGGNTQVIAFARGSYRIFGETIDIAVGNCLDRFARVASISNDPAPGYNIELLAREARAQDKAANDACAAYEAARHSELMESPVPPEKKHGPVEGEGERETSPPAPAAPLITLPYVVKGMDISLAGIMSSAAAHLKANPDTPKERLCLALEETLFAMLAEVAERAAAHVGASDFLIVGGVGCNKRLQEMLGIMAAERHGRVGGMNNLFAVDNGAMIAWTGVLMYQSNKQCALDPREADITQRFRTDEVDVTWR
ncbi:Kae1/TsaD family protein [Kipferlia bialata]|uniref:N(6)-L-threonylcarbamoyladenine synthase n=1 Tax=Kipferlia bialata TaxID=797122 RepID=A0A9K3CZ02_9EUKA|nr:Kae1/TsaD family protein [Kipferlia bialata]GIQ84981.1 Kae1/TsaD family protein [Kipferlia bialata]|eukprot:g4006.t1